ncbi:hypothetical protein HOF65_00610 [bacterium]|nr:hypothetical protein [bacterium]MBT3852547.1 hypothetical protein [bacterium]MBT4632713.1 hypothetical protein [bacterium]
MYESSFTTSSFCPINSSTLVSFSLSWFVQKDIAKPSFHALAVLHIR